LSNVKTASMCMRARSRTVPYPSPRSGRPPAPAPLWTSTRPASSMRPRPAATGRGGTARGGHGAWDDATPARAALRSPRVWGSWGGGTGMMRVRSTGWSRADGRSRHQRGQRVGVISARTGARRATVPPGGDCSGVFCCPARLRACDCEHTKASDDW
jgi:hypothetical protein